MPLTTTPNRELAVAGKAARKRLGRSALGPWDPARRESDALAIIRDQSASRLSTLIPIRHARMAVSPWTYYRGAAGVMAADLATGPNTGIDVQLCGDAHVLNFGLWATPERNLLFDLRDFDETLRGPFEWDVKRLVASIAVLAGDNKLPRRTAESAVAAALTGYRSGMAAHAKATELEVWYARVDVDGLLGFFESEDRARLGSFIERQARKRTSQGALDKLTEERDGVRRIKLNPPFRVGVDELMGTDLPQQVYDSYRHSLQDHLHHLLDRYHFVDAVRQVVGVGSVGMQVYLVLADGRCNDTDPLFLQVKQAGPSVYEQFLGPSPAASHGQRVVEGKRLLQTATDIFAGWTSAAGLDFYVRQFRDMKVIPDSERIAPRLVQFAAACGAVLARAHARSGDAAAIDGYIGRSDAFQRALTAYAFSYAEQNATDHAQLVAAIADGTVPAGIAY
ncbi:MAG: DUF2252 domain-containing protein [Ilumatobacteraceae bacterium]